MFFPRLSFLVLPLAVSAQDLGLIWSGHMRYCALGMCAGYALNVTLDIACVEDVKFP